MPDPAVWNQSIEKVKQRIGLREQSITIEGKGYLP